MASPTQLPLRRQPGIAVLPSCRPCSALEQGLELHHSKLNGRRVNVERSARGGGKTAQRTRAIEEWRSGHKNQTKSEVGAIIQVRSAGDH